MNGRKLFSLIAGVFLAGAMQASAIVGGPWDHLTPDAFSNSNPDGLYEGTVTMTNGSGFVRFTVNKEIEEIDEIDFNQLNQIVQIFSQNAGSGQTIPPGLFSQTLASQSNSVIFVQGNMYFGTTFGSVDISSGTVHGAGSGQSSLVDQIQSQAQSSAQTVNAIVDISGLSETLSMSFTGKITKRFPQLRYSAKGEVNLFSKPGLTVGPGAGGAAIIQVRGGSTSTTTTTTVSGNVRAVGDSAITGPAANGTITTAGSAFTTATGVTGTLQDGDIDQTGTVTTFTTGTVAGQALEPDSTHKIRVFGGRISRTVQIQQTQAANAAIQ